MQPHNDKEPNQKQFNAKKVANILLNDFKGLLNKHKVTPSSCGISPEDFVSLAKLLHCGIIEKSQFRDIVENKIIAEKEKATL